MRTFDQQLELFKKCVRWFAYVSLVLCLCTFQLFAVIGFLLLIPLVQEDPSVPPYIPPHKRPQPNYTPEAQQSLHQEPPSEDGKDITF